MFGIDPQNYWSQVDDAIFLGGIIVIFRNVAIESADVDIITGGPHSVTPTKIRWLLDYARDVVGLSVMIAYVDPDNLRSMRLIKWIGFEPAYFDVDQSKMVFRYDFD